MFLLFLPLLLLYLVGGLFVMLWGARWARRKFRSNFAYGGAFVLILTAVFGDEIYGYAYWQHLCSTQGGLHIYKQVPVEGFLYKEGDLIDPIVKDYLSFGYRYIEGTYSSDYGNAKGQIYRFNWTDDGTERLTRSPIKDPSSRYFSSRELINISRYIWEIEYAVRDRVSGEKIGAVRFLGYKGATVVRFLRNITGADFEGTAEYCGRNEYVYKNVVKETIPPINEKK